MDAYLISPDENEFFSETLEIKLIFRDHSRDCHDEGGLERISVKESSFIRLNIAIHLKRIN